MTIVTTQQPDTFDATVMRAAHAAVVAIEPAELPLLENLLNPPRRLLPWRHSDAVGFGVDDVVHWASPYVIAATLWYVRIWYDEGKSIIEQRTRRFVRRLAKDVKPPEVEPPKPSENGTLTAEQAQQHVRAVRQHAIALGLDEARAQLLAMAVVGTVVASHTDTATDG